MKLVVTLLLLSSLCFAKHKPKVIYDHVAKITYHAPQKHLKDLLEGRTDLFYDSNFYGDDYVCTPGDEHHSPDCRKRQDWYVGVVDQPASIALVLDDGRSIVLVADSFAGWKKMLCGPAPCDTGKPPSVANLDELIQGYYLGKEDTVFQIRYRLLEAGDVEIKPSSLK